MEGAFPITFLAVTEHHGPRSLLRLEGELDVCATDHLRRVVSDALEHHPVTLIADLSALSFIDCASLGVLVRAHEYLAAHGRELIITGCQPIVLRLLDLTGLDAHLHLSDEPADVLASGLG